MGQGWQGDDPTGAQGGGDTASAGGPPPWARNSGGGGDEDDGEDEDAVARSGRGHVTWPSPAGCRPQGRALPAAAEVWAWPPPPLAGAGARNAREGRSPKDDGRRGSTLLKAERVEAASPSAPLGAVPATTSAGGGGTPRAAVSLGAAAEPSTAVGSGGKSRAGAEGGRRGGPRRAAREDMSSSSSCSSSPVAAWSSSASSTSLSRSAHRSAGGSAASKAAAEVGDALFGAGRGQSEKEGVTRRGGVGGDEERCVVGGKWERLAKAHRVGTRGRRATRRAARRSPWACSRAAGAVAP